MLKRRHFSVDTSSPCREVQVSTAALGLRIRASSAAPEASTLAELLLDQSYRAGM
jgi:hypothetical protein